MMSKSISVLLFSVITMQFIACNKTSTAPSSVPVTASSIAGNFTVSSFVSSNDQTATFNGYTFTFNENGTLIATKGSDRVNGTWRFDDSNNTELKINFPTAPLNALNKSWHITELTDTHLLLTDDDDNHDDSNDDNPGSSNRIEFERD